MKKDCPTLSRQSESVSFAVVLPVHSLDSVLSAFEAKGSFIAQTPALPHLRKL